MGINPNTGTCDKCEEDKKKRAIEFYNKAVDDCVTCMNKLLSYEDITEYTKACINHLQQLKFK